MPKPTFHRDAVSSSEGFPPPRRISVCVWIYTSPSVVLTLCWGRGEVVLLSLPGPCRQRSPPSLGAVFSGPGRHTPLFSHSSDRSFSGS